MECSTCNRDLPRQAEFCPGCGTPVAKPTKKRPMPEAPRSLPPVAGLGIRFIALLIDGAIIGFTSKLISSVLPMSGKILQPLPHPESIEIPMVGSVTPFVLILLVAYYAIMEASRGATIGKLALGLTVRSMDGRRVEPLRAMLRAMLRVISFATGIGWLLALLTPRNQALHDLVVGTYVSERS